MVALMICKAELAEKSKSEKVKVVKKEEEKSIEPSGDTRPKKTIAPVHGVKTFTTEGAGIEISSSLAWHAYCYNIIASK